MSVKQPWCRDRNLFSTRFKVDPARRVEFLETFERLCDRATSFYERGCVFAFQGWARDPNEFVVFASWDEDVAMELRAVPEFQAYNRQLMDCCTGPVIMEQYSGMNCDRSIFDAHPPGKSKVHATGENYGIIFL